CSASYVTDTTVIQPGLGSLSGRAIRSLGEATLRGVDHVKMMRRFPLRDDAKHIPAPAIDELYDDLLEFTRVDTYQSSIQEKALRIILVQIAMGQINQLIAALQAPLWNPSLYLGILYHGCRLYNSYATAVEDTHGGHVSAIPFILFTSRLVRVNTIFCQVVLELGILDVLSSLCRAEDLPDQKVTLGPSTNTDTLNSRSLLIACNAMLLDIMAYTEYHSIIKCHPIMTSWPVACPRYRNGGDLKEDRPIARRDRLFLDHTMDVALADLRSSYLFISLPRLCTGKCISKLGAKELLSSLKTEPTHRQACRVFFLRFSLQQKEDVLKRLVEYMMQIWHQSSSDIDTLHGSFISEDIARFLELMFEISRLTIENRQALRNSGLCTLLKEVLNKCISDGYLFISLLCRPKYFLSLCERSDTSGLPDSVPKDPKLYHYIGVRPRSERSSEICTCTCRQVFQYSMALLVTLFEGIS
ncbi:hypothetical protein BDQ17DRAFT_1359989, partial [Cyathus striatus]